METSPIRHALEVRNPRHLDPMVVDVARAHNVAIVISHASEWPCLEIDTADFTYIRLHGPGRLYKSGNSTHQLSEWSASIRTRNSQGRDVFVYFDNDGEAHAPKDASTLIKLLESSSGPSVLGDCASLGGSRDND